MNDMVAIQVGQGSNSKVYYVSLALLLASGLSLPAGASISLPNPEMVKMMAAGVYDGPLADLAKHQFVAWGTTDSTTPIVSPVTQAASPAAYWETQRSGAGVLATDANLTLGTVNGVWVSDGVLPVPAWTATGATHDTLNLVWGGGILGGGSSLFSTGMLAGGDKTITIDNNQNASLTMAGGSVLQVNNWNAGLATWDELIINTNAGSSLDFTSNGTLVLADDYNAALRSTWTLGNSQTTLNGVFNVQLGTTDARSRIRLISLILLITVMVVVLAQS